MSSPYTTSDEFFEDTSNIMPAEDLVEAYVVERDRSSGNGDGDVDVDVDDAADARRGAERRRAGRTRR
jgi:hypothetical protein